MYLHAGIHVVGKAWNCGYKIYHPGMGIIRVNRILVVYVMCIIV